MTGVRAISQVIGGERLKGGEGALTTHVAIAQQYKSFFFSSLQMAERVGFEPTCPLRDKTLSRRPRYDHFGTSPLARTA